MNNHMKILKNNNLIGGSNKIANGGFPNLIINNNQYSGDKKQYKYNIDNNINKDIINIKNILEKRKEEKSSALINMDSDKINNRIKKREELYTNINLSDFD